MAARAEYSGVVYMPVEPIGAKAATTISVKDETAVATTFGVGRAHDLTLIT